MTTSEPASRGGRLLGMDALRGVAALLVVGAHLQFFYKTSFGASHGYLAVDLFFGLSGYVMARSYEGKFARGMNLRGFMQVRLKRLWPTMAIGAAFGLAAYWPLFPVNLAVILFLMALMFVPLFHNDYPCFPENSPAWSIFFELFANLVHVLVLCRLTVRQLLAISVLSGAVLLGFSRDLDVGVDLATFWLAFPRVLFSYCLGIALWRWRGDKPLFANEWALLMLIGGIVLAGLLPSGSAWADFVFVFALCPFIVAGGLAAPRFGQRFFALLGDLSFPIYAVHFPVIYLAKASGHGPVMAVISILCFAYLTMRLTGWLAMPRAKVMQPA